MPTLLDAIIESLRLTWSQIQLVSPKLLGAFLVLSAGWLVARGLRWTVTRLLRLLRVDSLAERVGVEDVLLRGGVRFTTVTLVGQIVYWVALIIGALAVFNLFGLPVTTDLIEPVTRYLPNVLLALVIVLFGALLARFVGGVAQTYLSNIGATASRPIGVMTETTILVFVATLALQELKLGSGLLVSAFQLAFGGVCLAAALAFGFGGRDWAAAMIERHWRAR